MAPRTELRRFASALVVPALFAAGACGGAKRDLSEQQLSVAVAAQQPSLERCYQSALETSPYRQEIRMDAAIHIAPSGKVTAVDLDGSGGLPGMSPCLKQAIMSWRFPEAKDATHTSLPLIFKPQVTKAQPDQAAIQQAVREALKSQAPK
jgi:hypothetical protein